MMFYAFNFTLVPNVAIILLNHTTHIILHTVPFPFCHIFYIGAGYTHNTGFAGIKGIVSLAGCNKNTELHLR